MGFIKYKIAHQQKASRKREAKVIRRESGIHPMSTVKVNKLIIIQADLLTLKEKTKLEIKQRNIN